MNQRIRKDAAFQKDYNAATTHHADVNFHFLSAGITRLKIFNFKIKLWR